MTMVHKQITITEEQAEWLEVNCKNLSKLVRSFLVIEMEEC